MKFYSAFFIMFWAVVLMAATFLVLDFIKWAII